MTCQQTVQCLFLLSECQRCLFLLCSEALLQLTEMCTADIVVRIHGEAF